MRRGVRDYAAVPLYRRLAGFHLLPVLRGTPVMSAPDITTVEMARSFSWMRLFSRCLVALLLFVAANVYTYETSAFFQRERAYTGEVSALTARRNVRIVFAGDSH